MYRPYNHSHILVYVTVLLEYYFLAKFAKVYVPQCIIALIIPVFAYRFYPPISCVTKFTGKINVSLKFFKLLSVPIF